MMMNASKVMKFDRLRLTTGKNEKEHSWHVLAIKFIGMKQLV